MTNNIENLNFIGDLEKDIVSQAENLLGESEMMNLPGESLVFCPSCGSNEGFAYIGEQERLRGEPHKLYNCNHCNSTRTYNSLDNYSSEVGIGFFI